MSLASSNRYNRDLEEVDLNTRINTKLALYSTIFAEQFNSSPLPFVLRYISCWKSRSVIEYSNFLETFFGVLFQKSSQIPSIRNFLDIPWRIANSETPDHSDYFNHAPPLNIGTSYFTIGARGRRFMNYNRPNR